MKLTDHFSIEEMTHTNYSEFQNENVIQAEAFKDNLTKVCLELEKVRDFVYRPVIVSSGFRCPALNKAVGGSLNSQHMTGGAADFTVKDFDDLHGLTFIFDWCCRHIIYGQLILENHKDRKPWIHLGIPREGKPRTRYVYEDGIYKPYGIVL